MDEPRELFRVGCCQYAKCHDLNTQWLTERLNGQEEWSLL